MASCPNCGKEGAGAYCSECGTSLLDTKPKHKTSRIVFLAFGWFFVGVGIIILIALIVSSWQEPVGMLTAPFSLLFIGPGIALILLDRKKRK